MSPILTRPIREQLEHDRVIRQLQARYKRKHEVAINPGSEQNDSVSAGELTVYPDLVLYSQERGRRLEGTVEVETVESVTTLEAQFEWGMFSKLRAPFHLYVPAQALDSARRLCDELHLGVSEIWTYHVGLDQQVRFTLAYRSPEAIKAEAALKSAPGAKKAAKSVVKKPATPPVKQRAKAKPAAKAQKNQKKKTSMPSRSTPKAAKGSTARVATAKKASAKKAATRPSSKTRR